MASRPMIAPFPAIVNGNMSSNITSAVTIIQNTSMISYTIDWTGAPTGTFQVQVSNDYSQNAAGQVSNPGTWVALPLSTMPAASGSAGTGFIDIYQTAAYAIRLQYLASSGTGTLQAVLNGKVQ